MSGKSLFQRTFLLTGGFLLAFVTLFNFYLVRSQEEALIDVMNSKAGTIAKSIALVSADAMVTEDDSFIVEHIQKVLEDNEEIVYTLVSRRNGYSILNTPQNWELRDTLPREIEAFHGAAVQGGMLSSSLAPQQVYHFSYPVVFSGIKWGWVDIGFTLDSYERSMKTIFYNTLLLLGVMMLMATLLAYLLARWLTRPILSLNEAAKRVAAGDLGVNVARHSTREIAELIDAFNRMVESLQESDRKMRSYNEELERRVDRRTRELNALNLELDKRVQEEVEARAEQQRLLIQQSRFAAMGEMIGNIAHQWRQPLNALGLLMQNVENAYEMGILDEGFIRKSVEKSNRLTQMMSQTIDDFRNFFRPNKVAEVFALSSALETTMHIIRSSLENNLITIDEYVDGSLCTEGFVSEFAQVLLNILSNAKDTLLERREENRTIWIRIRRRDDKVQIEIEDNGGGIPEAVAEKIFDPYFTTKDEGKGTGIGLYMSKMIIENNMHGSLRVHNTPNGACFVITVVARECMRD